MRKRLLTVLLATAFSTAAAQAAVLNPGFEDGTVGVLPAGSLPNWTSSPGDGLYRYGE